MQAHDPLIIYFTYLLEGYGIDFMPSVNRSYGSATIFPIIPDPNTINPKIPDL